MLFQCISNPLKKCRFLAAVTALLAVSVNPINVAVGQLMIRGTDISALPVLENAGATYSDASVAGDAIDILEAKGVNSHRLRIFVDPLGTDPFAVQDLDYTIALAQRAKANGSTLLLDFHYSDSWADPGKQTKPAAWTGLNFSQLEQQVYSYTRNVVEQFDTAGVQPEMIQIGNEIGNGILWADGRLWRAGVSENTQFDKLATLLSAGINGARDGSGAGHEPKIMIHHANGADWGTTSYYFDRLLPRLQANGTDIDAIGYSYYPKFHYNPSNGQGDVTDLQQNLNNSAANYNKPVVVVEAGFASRGAQFEPTYEFEVSPTGQRDFLQAVVDAVTAVPNQKGQGVFWWYPEAVPTAGLDVWEDGRYGLFDQHGNLNPAIEVFAADASPSDPPAQFFISLLENANSWPGSSANPGIYGQGFSPAVGATPNPNHPGTEVVRLDHFTFFKDGNTDTASNIKLAIIDDFFMDLSNLSANSPELIGLSTNMIASTSGLSVGDAYSFDFDHLQLEFGADYAAIFVSDDGQGNLTPVKVSALTANYAETSPGSGVWLPTSNYGATANFQHATGNSINSNQFGSFLASFAAGGDAKFKAVFDTRAPGDFDENGAVDSEDLMKWERDYGINHNSDADRDSDTDGTDFLVWQRNYQALSSSASGIAVPEPNSLSIVLSAVTALLKVHRGG